MKTPRTDIISREICAHTIVKSGFNGIGFSQIDIPSIMMKLSIQDFSDFVVEKLIRRLDGSVIESYLSEFPHAESGWIYSYGSKRALITFDVIKCYGIHRNGRRVRVKDRVTITLRIKDYQ